MDIRTDGQRGTDGHTEDTEKENRQENPSNVYLAHTHSLLKPEEFEENYIFGQCLEKMGISRRSSTENLLMGGGGGGGIDQDDRCEFFIYIYIYLFLTEECSNCASY